MRDEFDLLGFTQFIELPERLTSIESWHRHMPFAFALLHMARPDNMVELGTHRGDSFCAFCQGVEQQRLPTRCYAVDTWQGDSQAGFYGEDILKDLASWHQPRFSRFASLLQMTFDEALDSFSDGSVDLLHIDGLHTYEAVKHDFESWLPKMSRRGVVLFHDTNVRRDDFGVWKLWDELKEKYPSFEFPYSFGLGVLVVGDTPSEEVTAFIDYAHSNAEQVITFFHRMGDAAEVMKLRREVDTVVALRESVGEQLMQARAVVELRDQQLSQMGVRVEEMGAQTHQLHGHIESLKQDLASQAANFAAQLEYAEQEHSATLDKLKRSERRRIAEYEKLQRLSLSRLWRSRNRLMHALGRSEQVIEAGKDVEGTEDFNLPAIDIVVPVYRGLEDTRRCIESVLNSHCHTRAELIVINDASPEPALVQWLESQSHRFRLLHNETNLGFVATVNRGMRLHPWRDVVLLNSDTEVANDWLDRLVRAAQASPDTASITPFSNNATICSYPLFCADNNLPKGTTVASMDGLAAEANAGERVEIPTAIGFCMLIKRKCLEDVGLFDEQRFGKGYGEENEFCFRSARRGWKHYLAADVFVFHKGGVSFADTQAANQQFGHRALLELFPTYDAEIQAYVRGDPAAKVRLQLDMALSQSSGKPAVLIVNHRRGGGTTRHVRELVKALEGQAEFWLLEPQEEGIDFMLALLDSDGQPRNREIFVADGDLEVLLQRLRSAGIKKVHYQHVVGLHPAASQLHLRLGLPYFVSIHDFYFACPQVTMTDAEGRFCGAPDEAGCNACLHERPVAGAEDISQWRENSRSLLVGAERIFVPSEDTGSRLSRYFPDLEFTYAAHEPGLAIGAVHVQTLDESEPLKVAVLGALSVFKGPDVLEACARAAWEQGLPLEFHLVGFAYRELESRPNSNLVVHGSYKDADLPSLLSSLKPHLIWFPGSCPETYSYTLSACLELGYPVVAPDIGSFPERLAGRQWTWLVSVDRAVDSINAHFLAVRDSLIRCDAPVSLPATVERESFCYRTDYFNASSATHGEVQMPTSSSGLFREKQL